MSTADVSKTLGGALVRFALSTTILTVGMVLLAASGMQGA